jgi:NAD+ kinase
LKRIGILYHPKIESAKAFAGELEKLLASLGASAWLWSAWDEVGARSQMKGTELVLSVGGDGTVLRAGRAAAPMSIPVVGINLGKLGFLTELGAADARDKLPAMLAGEGWIDERAMLQAELAGKEPLHALNDVVVGRGAKPRVIYVDITIDGAPLTTYKSDGVIIATATGSTGYSLALGGPILYPQAREMVLSPIAPHPTLDNSLVLSPTSLVEMKVYTDEAAVLSIDGQVHLELNDGDEVKVSLSPRVSKFLRLQPPTFFYSTLVKRLVPR